MHSPTPSPIASKLARIALSLSILILAAPAQAHALTAAVEDNAVVARGAGGRMLWRYRLPDSSAAQTASLKPDGSVWLSGGDRLDRDGRLVRNSQRGAAGVSALPVWDAPVALGVANNEVTGPAFDGQGNGYALAYHYDFSSPNQVPVYVYRANGASSDWTTLPPLAGNVASVFRPTIAVDTAGNITVVYRMSESYQLVVERYTPAGGWQQPLVIYSGDVFFQDFASTVDAQGNVTVLAGIGNGDTLALESFRLSAASGEWQTESIASNVNDHTNEPFTLGRSPDMTQLLAAYMTSGATQGVAVQKYLSSSSGWGAAEQVPGTEAAANQFELSVLAATIDDNAHATVITPFAASGSRWSLWGLRDSSSSSATSSTQPWSRKMLLDWRLLAGSEVFSLDAIVDSRGVVMSGLVHQEGGPSDYQVSMFRFTPQLGWSIETVASYSVTAGGVYGATAAPLAWVGAPGDVVALYYLFVSGSIIVPVSLYSEGSNWHRFAFPGGGSGPIGTNASGDVLLLNTAANDITARWLKP